MTYLEWRRRRPRRRGEGYGDGHTQRAGAVRPTSGWRIRPIAILPLVLVGVMNKVFTVADPASLRRPRTRFDLAGDGDSRW